MAKPQASTPNKLQKPKSLIINNLFQAWDNSIRSGPLSFKFCIFLETYEQLLALLLLTLSKNTILGRNLSVITSILRWLTLAPLFELDFQLYVSIALYLFLAFFNIATIYLTFQAQTNKRILPIIKYTRSLELHVIHIPFLLCCTFMSYIQFTKSDPFMILSIFFLLLQNLRYLLQDKIGFNFGFKAEDASRRSPKNTDFLRALCLQAANIVLAIQNRTDSTWATFFILTVSILLFSASKIYEGLIQMCYHDKIYSKWRLALTLLVLTINLWQIVIFNLTALELLVENFLVISLASYLFMLVFLLNFRNYLVKTLIIEPVDNIQSEYQFQCKMRNGYQIFLQSKEKKVELMKSALIQAHTRECVVVTCICKGKQQLYDPITRQVSSPSTRLHKDKIFIRHFLKMQFEEGIAKFPDSFLISLSYLYYLQESLQLYQKVSYQLILFLARYGDSLDLSFRYLVFFLRNSIKILLDMKNRTNQTLRIEDVEIFDFQLSSLDYRMRLLIENYQYFWKNLSQFTVDRNNILKLSHSISDARQQVERQYRECLQINRNSHSLLNLMRLYSTKIVLDSALYQQIQGEISPPLENIMEQKIKNYEPSLISSKRACVIKVGVSKQDLGLIRWTSQNFPSVFGYERKEIIGKQLQILMPSIYRNNHVQKMLSWMETGTQNNMNKLHLLWAVSKGSICFSCKIYTKVVSTPEGLELIGLLSQSNTTDYILTENQFGSIITAGTTLYNTVFQCEPKLLSDAKLTNKIFLSMFSPELFVILKQREKDTIIEPQDQAMHRDHPKYMIKPPEVMTVHILVPKNISMFLEKFVEEYDRLCQSLEEESQDIQQAESQKQIKLEHLILNYLGDLIVDVNTLPKIIHAKIELSTYGIDKNRFTAIKFIELLTLKQVPEFLKNLEENQKQSTLRRVAHIRQSRSRDVLTQAQRIFEEIFVRKFSEFSQKLSKRASFKSDIRSTTKSSLKNQARTFKTQEIGKATVRSTLTKVRNVLIKQQILGASAFSVFSPKAQPKSGIMTITSKLHDYEQIPTISQLKTADLHQYESDEEDTKVLVSAKSQTGVQLEIKSIRSSLHQSEIQIDYRNIKKYQMSGETHHSLKYARMVIFLLLVAYLSLKIVHMLLVDLLEPQILKMIQSQTEYKQVLLLVYMLGHSSFSVYHTQDLQRSISQNSMSVENTSKSINLFLSRMLQDHSLFKSKTTFMNVHYYLYLDSQMSLRLTNNTQNIDVLEGIYFYQRCTTKFICKAENNISNSEVQDSFRSLHANYEQLSQIFSQVTELYHRSIRTLIETFSYLGRTLLALKCISLTGMLFLASRIVKTADMWLTETMDTLSTIPAELAGELAEYFKSIKQETNYKKPHEIQTQTTININSHPESRTVSARGKIHSMSLIPFLGLLLILILSQLSVISNQQIYNKAAVFEGLNNDLLVSYSTIAQNILELRNCYLFNQTCPDSDTGSSAYNPSFIHQRAYKAFGSTDFSQELNLLSKQNLCNTNQLEQQILIDRDNCNSSARFREGVIFMGQFIFSCLQEAAQKYTEGWSSYKSYIQSTQWEEVSIGIYYLVRRWFTIDDLFIRNIQSSIKSIAALRDTLVILGYVLFVMFGVYFWYVSILIQRSVKNIHNYLLIIPQLCVKDNGFFKRFIRKFLP